MPTNPNKDIKTLSFRISRTLWIRIGDTARRLGVSTQAFCTQAIERQLDRAEKKHNGDANGKSVRTALPEIRSKSSQGGK